MQLSDGTAALGMDALRARVAEFEKRLKEIVDARDESDRGASGKKRDEDDTFAKAAAKLAGELDARRKELKARHEESRRRAQDVSSRRLAAVDRALETATRRAQGKLTGQIDQLKKKQSTARDKSLHSLHETQARLTRQLDGLLAGIVTVRKESEEWRGEVEVFARSVRVRPEDEFPATGRFQESKSEEIAPHVKQGLLEETRFLQYRRREFWLWLVRTFSYPAVVILLALLHGGAFAGIHFLRPELEERATVLVPLIFGGSLVIAFAILHVLRSKARELANAFRGRASEMTSELRKHEELVGKRIAAGREKGLEDKIGAVADLDEQLETGLEDAKKSAAPRIEMLKKKHAGLLDRVRRRNSQRMSGVEGRFDAESKAVEARHGKELEDRRAAQAKGGGEALSRGAAVRQKLAADWSETVGAFTRMTEEARSRGLKQIPPWSDPSWRDYRMPEEFPATVHLGDAVVDFSPFAGARGSGEPFSLPDNGRLALPLSLSFPERGNMLVSTDAKSRPRAVEAVSGAVLRTLAAFPGAKAKFLFVDPVGLGQSFSALMHLADDDESLVGGRIWTETPHIEKKLSELTEHIEKVIQKYLRNRYASIDQYNREVGQMAEAYRFLVIADFPRGFSDMAMDRLAGIVASGARCGVFTLLFHERGQKFPAAFTAPRFRPHGLVLTAANDVLTVDEEILPRAVVAPEPPPESAVLTPLLHSIGKQCAAAGRVEVPFETVAPPDGQWASQSTETGVRIPLGRSGADKLQYIDLGRGTAQHALIAGKTGSGKSTLFHVMITNSSLWYGPRELELYLIDFKKGVEFKRFATHRLPHARVVAIESDREFGLSVLRRIDRELGERAELYRAAGVQDFAGYRKTGKGDYLPRTLLLIDEFQEFFTEEDATAQEAALMLDRIVRQGRAFGVHVILGSQTLGGSYTLAKATLGQMGIRIALQCNEADSLLILGDDNAAARLLSRPGEAIYNDMSGMLEGNSPFQVVWMSDAVEEKYLARLRQLADEKGWEPREATTVFEGNLPADIRNNDLLRKRLARPFVSDGGPATRAWVGEANAIKGPTEVRFQRQAGSNLMIVGQQRESSLSVVLSTIVSLASLHAPKSARFIVLDGSPPEASDARRLQDLAAALPHEIEMVEYARVPQVMEELDAELKAREESGGSGAPPIYLFVYDLQRFRKLRQGDEYDMSSTEGEKPAPDKCLVNVLTEGPSRGIFTIVWCDSLGNLKRTFTMKTLREFGIRLLFQMSGADSSELIDTPAAAKLGLYRGLLFVEEEGTVEKFRPYALPDEARMSEIVRAIKAAPAQVKEA
ncbi:MAG: DNA segregation ATPase [Planctomycetota bacterium]|nr:MAG: DNA segregation ATPase [Planctomycetota bacterium]